MELQEDDIKKCAQQFKEVYDSLGGRHYMLIHEIRNRLKWPKDYFNNVLKKLAKDDLIFLQSGNPSVLSEKEMEDSYKDSRGYLKIIVTWKGKPIKYTQKDDFLKIKNHLSDHGYTIHEQLK